MRILVVEDDQLLARSYEKRLRRLGHDVEMAFCVQDAERSGLHNRYDAAVVDWGLPDGDGLTLCKRLRAVQLDAVIVMVTGRTDVGDEDKVRAFDEAGADDYLMKPVSLDELLARVRRHAARSDRAGRTMRVGGIVVALDHPLVHACGCRVEVTELEWHLLLALAKRAPALVTRQQLLAAIWGTKRDDTRKLDVHVSHVRSKLGVAGAQLRTARGTGFWLDLTLGDAKPD